MDLAFSESEEMLKHSVRSFVEREANKDVLVDLPATGCRSEWQSAMKEAGWLGLLVSSAAGEPVASAVETGLVLEELGRGPVPGPYFSSSILAVLLLQGTGGGDFCDALLDEIARGVAIVAVALCEPGLSWQGFSNIALTTSKEAESLVLNGVKTFVPYAEAATHLVVAVQDAQDAEEIAFVIVDRNAPGIVIRHLTGFLAWNYEVEFRSVVIDPARVVPARHGRSALDDSLRRALALLSAYQVGGCDRLLELSIDYSNTRYQFGVPIGTFQRVQDHIVRIVNALDAARFATYETLWKIDTNRDFAASAHLAKATSSESYFEAANAAHEVHAGIGSDPRFGLSIFTQMSRSLYDYLGSPRWHKQQVPELLEWVSAN